MSTHRVENTISQNPPARTSSELGTFVPVAEVSDLGELLAGADSCSRAPTSLRSATVRIGLGETDDCPRPRACRGFTLVELLVVVFILLLVSAASIPIIAPALQGRHIREASRQVNSYFAVARDTALRNGRPVGVSIERFVSKDETGNAVGMISEMSVLLQQMEVPEPYSGDFAESRMFFEYDTSSTPITIKVIFVGTDPSTPIADIGWAGLVRVGDCLQLNHSGRLFEIVGDSQSTTAAFPVESIPSPSSTPATDFWLIQPVDKSLPFTIPPNAYRPDAMMSPDIWRSPLIPPEGPAGAAYTIIRQPVKTATPPLQLTGTVILDLNWSGDSENGVFSPRDSSTLAKLTATLPSGGARVEDTRPVVIMFAPDGSLERVYRSVWNDPDGSGPLDPVWRWIGASAARPTGPIHLLIGQRDGVPANPNGFDTDGTPPPAPTPESQELNNWRNADNLWITIHPQTGLLTTTEMGTVDPAHEADPYGFGLRDARYFATRAKSMGGR